MRGIPLTGNAATTSPKSGRIRRRLMVQFQVQDRWHDERGSYVAFKIVVNDVVATADDCEEALVCLPADEFELLANPGTVLPEPPIEAYDAPEPG